MWQQRFGSAFLILFFTTKEKHLGTGLGLASAYGIIKNHNGTITVCSEPGKGTSFNIYLPISERMPVYEEVPMVKLAQGKETILLVDDEKIILDVSRAVLEAIG
jgi:two-component system cell cycle sensor histidine kinase/response regulator CckA